MNLETYEQRARELGISRGAFEPDGEFKPDPFGAGCVQPYKERKYYKDGTHEVVRTPPELLVDLSHLNPPHKEYQPWLTPEKKAAWLAKRRATLAAKGVLGVDGKR